MTPKQSCRIPGWVKLLLLISIVVGYMIAGAAIFSSLEGPEEAEERLALKEARSSFLLDNTCVTDLELEKFIIEVVRAADRGVSAINNVSMVPNWSFGQSVFFAGTVMTTIGYGHVAPLSDGGKGFCIVFALIGIPLTLIMFTAIVHRLLIPTNLFLDFLKQKLGHIHSNFHIRLLHLLIVVVTIVIFMFIVPSAIFSAVEPGWSFFSSFYYCFISLTTIGLGDYIPGDHPDEYAAERPIYKVAITAYLLVGLTFMMLLLAVLYEIPELNIGLHFYLDDVAGNTADEEKVKLRSASDSGPKYTEHTNDYSPSYQQSEPGELSEETKLTPH